MKFYQVQFDELIWIYDVHSIRILSYPVVRLYSEVNRVFSLSFEIQTSYCTGFGDRLLGEIKRIAPKEVKIKISAPRERLYSTWIG